MPDAVALFAHVLAELAEHWERKGVVWPSTLKLACAARMPTPAPALATHSYVTPETKAATRIQTAFRAHATRLRYHHVTRHTSALTSVLLPGEMVAYTSLLVLLYVRGPRRPPLWRRLAASVVDGLPRRVYLVATTRQRLLVATAAAPRRALFTVGAPQSRVEMCRDCPARFHLFSAVPNANGHTVFGFADVVDTASAWAELIGTRPLPSASGVLAVCRANSMHSMSFAPVLSGLVRETAPRRRRWFMALSGATLLLFPASNARAAAHTMLDVSALASVGASTSHPDSGLFILTPDAPLGLNLVAPCERERDAWLRALNDVVESQMRSYTRRFVERGLPAPSWCAASSSSSSSQERWRNPRRVNATRPNQWPIKCKSLALIQV